MYFWLFSLSSSKGSFNLKSSLINVVFSSGNSINFSFNFNFGERLINLLGNKRIIEVNYEMNLKNIFENMSICPERKLIVKDKKV